MEDINVKIDKIQQEVDEVRNDIDNLSSSNSIPRDVETALRERLQLISASGTTGSATTQSIIISSTPQTITVPAQPTGTVGIVIAGVTYNVLYK